MVVFWIFADSLYVQFEENAYSLRLVVILGITTWAKILTTYIFIKVAPLIDLYYKWQPNINFCK